MKPEQFIDEMLDVLETDGWGREFFTGDDGSHCIVGAMAEVNRRYSRVQAPVANAVMGALKKQLIEQYPNRAWRSYVLYEYNDKVARDFADIRGLLKTVRDEFVTS